MYQMIANTHDFQINLLVNTANGETRSVALPPKQRGRLNEGETVSEQSLRDYPKLKVAEIPDTPPVQGNPANNDNEVPE